MTTRGNARSAGESTAEAPPGRGIAAPTAATERFVDTLRRRVGLDGLRGSSSLFPLFVLFALNAVDELDQGAFRVLLPEIRDHFGLSTTGVAALSVALVPMVMVASLPIGYLADRSKRTRLAAGGAMIWALFSVGTGLAPTIAALLACRAAAGLGRAVNRPTHQGLLADYYPPANRVAVFSFWALANSVGQFAGPLLAGVLASAWGWRAPFILLAVPTLVAIGFALRLREPARGAQERTPEGTKAIKTPPLGPIESWRLLRAIPSVRRLWWALPFLLGGVLGFVILLPLYYDEVFAVSEIGRGTLAASAEPFYVAGLLLGIPYATRIVRTEPERVFRLFGAIGAVVAIGLAVIAVAPNVYVAAATSMTIAFTSAIIGPGFSAVYSILIPPHVRSFAYSLNDVFVLPGLLFTILAAWVGEQWGLRVGMLAMAPIFLVGASIVASAARLAARDLERGSRSPLRDASGSSAAG